MTMLKNADLRTLYPEIDPFHKGFLQCGRNEIYFECSGKKDGLPIVIVHGGPGGGTNPGLRRYFNPEIYHIILFDQRGCGLSRPHASDDQDLSDNTTHLLIEDMEALKRHLGLEKWVVFGGSWGSTLALSYAINHPESVMGLVLRGIFLVRPSELLWFYQDGASHVWPDLWENYIAPIPQDERHDLLTAFYKRLHGDNRAEQLACARAWSQWEGATLSIHGRSAMSDKFDEDAFVIAFARIESWYFQNKAFLPSENWILDNIDAIRHIPTHIIQGRYDLVTPMRSAWDLHKAFPEALLNIVHFGGHASSDEAILDALLRACDEMGDRFKV